MAVAGAAIVMLTLLVVASAAVRTAPSSSHHVPLFRGESRLEASRDAASLAHIQQRAKAREVARERWLASPAARTQRAASQMAFHRMSAVGAQRLLVHDYVRSLAADSVNPAATIAHGGRVLRYLSDSRAVVASTHGLRIVTSTVPLQVKGAGGVMAPVNLDLTQRAKWLAPSRPLAPVRIARDSSGRAVVGSTGVSIALVGRSVQGTLSGASTAFFANVGRDLDAAVVPRLSGVDILAVLRSRLSSRTLRYVVRVPSGAALRAATGGAVISRAGAVLARISSPSAHDAQGSNVPVTMRVAGDELVVHVDATSAVAYPVLVDPEVWVQNLAETPEKNWTYLSNTSEGVHAEHSFPAGGPISISTSGTISGNAHKEWAGSGGGEYRWKPPETLEEVTSVELLGVSAKVAGSATETKTKKTPWWGVNASAQACVVSYSDYNEPLGSGEGRAERHELTSTMHYYNHTKENFHCNINEIALNADMSASSSASHEEEAEPTEETISATMEASLSVGAVLLYQEMSYGELREWEAEQYGSSNAGKPGAPPCLLGKPVNCATGNETETQTDLSVGGRGLGLQLTRTYNSRLAVYSESPGMFGYGWTSSYSAHIATSLRCDNWSAPEKERVCIPLATVYQDNGSTVRFEDPHGTWKPVAPLVQSTLAKEGSTYVYTLPNQTKLYFSEAGLLTKEAERNGNALTMTRNSEGRLESVSDAAGRKLTFAYNSEGRVSSVTDPMGHAVKYTYESKELATVTQPGETKLRWKFKYGTKDQLTSETDGREHATAFEYNGSYQVTSETDPMSRKRSWEYATITKGTETKITEPNGAVTVEAFNEMQQPTSVTHAYGTSLAATTTSEYNTAGDLASVTDPAKHKTEYGYDSEGNRTSAKDADGDETKWKYDGKHDIETETTPDGETTTIKRNTAGDPEVIERPAPGATTQKTTYKYDGSGDVESMTNPLERTWKYEYDSHGDRKSEIDPEGNKRTREYNEDSQETAEVSPRGNAAGAEPSKFTTKRELSAKGHPLKITDPLGHTAKYTYDGDGNVETMTDGNSHTATYTFNNDNELTKVKQPNGSVTETEYDAMGQVTSQTDGNKHVTKYVRNLLEQVEEVVNPLGKKTLKEYNAVGNVVKLTDPTGRSTTYTYDPAKRLTEVVYSTGTPATIKYEYAKDGETTKLTDGTGTTNYTYDQLDRLTESENGHKEVIKYEYNLANEPTKITYPNGKTVERAYDKDARLEKVTDWLSHATKFVYDQDSELKAIAFPSETKDEDTYAYNDADQMSEVKMDKSTEVLASLVYTRDNDGQVKQTTAKGLPGTEVTETTQDENNRLTKAGSTEYKYDAANDPTKEGAIAYEYNEGDEITKGTGATYSYDELGERTKATPEKGPATTYGYDQASNMFSVERPKEGTTAEIKDAYAYNGEGLRVSQTIAGTTTYMAWDAAEELPLLLSDGTNTYIYGPGGLPIEQINTSTGPVTYLHHDQQGSTRLLTGSTGTVTGKCTYGAYGTPTCEGTATTPLGFDAQYTSSDTGLVYMRNRVYDPTTAQFLTVDPAVGVTRAPYNYAGDNPVNHRDPTGLSAEGLEGVPCYWPVCGPPPPAVEGVQHGIEGITHGIESAWNEVNEAEEPNDEGEAALHENEAQRECGERNPAQDKKLSPGQIKKLKEGGFDPHELKLGAGEDLYTDPEGNIYAKPIGGAGPGEPIGINIKNLP
jgi:RHS repeat-associated protein